MYDDDKDVQVSSSSADYFSSPEKAKRDALKQELQKEGIAKSALQNDALLGLKKSVLLSQVAGKKDEEKKRDQKQKEAKPTTFGTKTREQEILDAKLSADTKQTADSIVKKEEADAKTHEEMKEQESTSEDA